MSTTQNYYGFIYLTTNNVNGMQYIGQRKYHPDNSKSDQEYLGSGTRLKEAFIEFGKDKFSKIILEECKTQEDLNNAEIKWIAKYNAVRDPKFYNISSGGSMIGDSYTGQSDEYKKHFREIIAKSNRTRSRNVENIIGEKNPAFGRHWYKDETTKTQYYLYPDDPRIVQLNLVMGLYRTAAHNEKIGKSLLGKKKQYQVHAKGKIWITDGTDNKLIEPANLEYYKNKGYSVGMTHHVDKG